MKRKKNLIFISNFIFNFYVKDPSNYDEKFQRIRVRNLLEQLKNDGLDNKKFAKTIKNLRYSDDVIEYYVRKNLLKNSFFQKKESNNCK